MDRKPVDPVQRRNALLATSAAIMLMAVAQRPSLALFFTSAATAAEMAVVAAAALFLAMAIREFAQVLLRGPGDPWYARRGAFVALAIAVFAVNALLSVFCAIGLMPAALAPMLHRHDFRCQLTAFEVLWVVLLEWVSYEN